jgi:hypothetical protein
MDGLNVSCRQPRQQYTRVEDKFIVEHWKHMEEQLEAMGDHIKVLITKLFNMGGHIGSGFENPYAEHQAHRRQHYVQAHATQWVNGFKLNIPKFQGCLQLEEFHVT